ncbi:hypothetical protein J7L68_06165 [bacterium]|nr:hypothetical protein [bacterium]
MNQVENHEKQHPAMVVKMPDGSERAVSYEELTLSNNLTMEAIVRVLIKKGVFTPDEFVQELEKIETERAPENDNKK